MVLTVIPKPQSMKIKGEKIVFVLTDLVNIIAFDGAENANKDLLSFLKKSFEIVPTGSGKESIIIKIGGEKRAEGYKLTVGYDMVEIEAGDGAGAFYAVQTLKQLLLQSEGKLPEIQIEDFPQYEWRGFMFDCSRYFFPVEDVKSFLDAMALHKLNRFHWHLTDDQGWRVEIYNKLLLSQVGGFRAFTNFGRKPHGGFYSKADIEEIVNYAHERFIKVIPEIDQPGHSVSAIAAYPELSCFERELPVATHTGIKYDVLCVGKESTFDFVFAVLDEVCEMFPDKIIHIGGDEVPTERWKYCPHCQKKMKELGLKNEEGLHTYYLTRIYEYLKEKGFEVIMWNDSSAESKIPNEVVWQCWNDSLDQKQMAFQLEKGRKLINSKSEAYYLDLPYGRVNLKKCYEYDLSCGVSGKAAENLLGGEACLWTEYVPDTKKAGYCTFPRLAAFCENAWSDPKSKSYEEFKKKIPNYFGMLDKLGFLHASLNQAMPKPIRKYGYNLYFERRQLHWQGLHNVIDNRKVRKEAKRRSEGEK